MSSTPSDRLNVWKVRDSLQNKKMQPLDAVARGASAAAEAPKAKGASIAARALRVCITATPVNPGATRND
jgi:hypothetical protein